jgi:hypothetical protein
LNLNQTACKTDLDLIKKGSLKKNCGLDLVGQSGRAMGRPESSRRVQEASTNARLAGPASQSRRIPNRYGKTGAVGSSRDRRSPVVSFLWPRGRQAKTLTRTGGASGSPGGFPQRRRSEGVMRRSSASPTVGGSGRLGSGAMTYASTTRRPESDA